MKLNKKHIMGLMLIITLALISACNSDSSENAETSLVKLAKCLTENDATLYGAYWCHNCVDQKTMFVEAAEYLNYVECTEQQELCKQEEIRAYPTWKFKSGDILIGRQPFESLSAASGCSLE